MSLPHTVCIGLFATAVRADCFTQLFGRECANQAQEQDEDGHDEFVQEGDESEGGDEDDDDYEDEEDDGDDDDDYDYEEEEQVRSCSPFAYIPTVYQTRVLVVGAGPRNYHKDAQVRKPCQSCDTLEHLSALRW